MERRIFMCIFEYSCCSLLTKWMLSKNYNCYRIQMDLATKVSKTKRTIISCKRKLQGFNIRSIGFSVRKYTASYIGVIFNAGCSRRPAIRNSLVAFFTTQVNASLEIFSIDLNV